MNPSNQTNPLYKKIGILVGIVAVLAVLIVTFSNEGSSKNQASTNTVSPSSVNSETVAQNSDNGNTSSQQSDDSDNNNANTQTAPTVQTTAIVPKKTITSTKVSSVYKNGTYTANGSYMTPEGQVAINVSVTLVNDIITDANVTSASGGRTSVRYQDKFIAGYKQYVVGKNIADVQLSKVSGSSLTPEGFNNAIATIKAQAHA